jgi:transcriptional regulator with XRE-family HTH domain
MKGQSPIVTSARAALARTLSDARAGAALSRREVALRMGYQNVAKGCSRIAEWERGDDVPRGDRPARLAEALPDAADAIMAAIDVEAGASEEARSTEDRVATGDRQAADREAQLLVTHRAALTAALELPDGAWLRPTRLSCARVSLAYIGGRMLRLGELLELWAAGHLHAPCPCHDRPMPVFAVAGSPLSGTHRLRGVCSVSGEVVAGQHQEQTLLSFVRPALGRLRAAPGPGPSLEVALRASGCPASPAPIRRLGGALFATWCGEEEVLRAPDGAVMAVLRWDGEHSSWEAIRGPCRSGGAPVIGSLSPVTFGAWRGEHLVVTPAPHRAWRAAAGHLADPLGRPRLTWTCQPPPRVVAWLARELERST